MDVELWQAGVATAVAGATGFFGRKSKGEREAEIERSRAEAEERRENSAKLLLESYGLLLDEYKESRADDRKHIHRQDEELKELRNEIRALREARDTETASLRAELASVRSELATVREENTHLRAEVAGLRAGRRSTDVTPA